MTEEARDLLIEKGSNMEYGARPLRRTIEHLLEDPLSEDLLRGAFAGKDKLTVVVGDGAEGEKKLVFDATVTEQPVQPPELVEAGSK